MPPVGLLLELPYHDARFLQGLLHFADVDIPGVVLSSIDWAAAKPAGPPSTTRTSVSARTGVDLPASITVCIPGLPLIRSLFGC